MADKAQSKLGWRRFSDSHNRASVGVIALMAFLLVASSLFFITVTSEPVQAQIYGVWDKKGIVIEPAGASWTCAVESSVLYEGNPQILTEEVTVFKMWYRESYVPANGNVRICYAESVDGETWTKYPDNPVLSTGEKLVCPFVMKHDGVYYLYVHSDWSHVDRFYSSDGLNWTKDKDDTLVTGIGWDGTALGNLFVWVEGTNDWKMLYEAYGSGTYWKIGLATSSDGKTWTKSGDNPVLEDVGSCGGPEVHKVDSTYYMWYHNAASGNLPTDICRASSTNLTEWTKYGGSTHPVFWRTEDYEGVGNPQGQVADVSIIEVGGNTYSFYDVVVDQSPPPNHRIALAKTNLTISQLVQTAEMGEEGGGAGWLTGWAKRIKLTLDHTDIDAALSNFPVLVYLSTSSGRTPTDVSCVFDELTSDANRKKIAVTKSDGTTQCYVEIEKWDDANEHAWLWVKVPDISDSADTDLYLYYDSSQPNNTTYVGDPSDAVVHNVWDANHKLVTHMRDDPDTSHVRDSTVNANDGTKKGANEPIEVDGKIAKAQDFDGTNDFIDIGILGNFGSTLDNPKTTTLWIKTNSTSSSCVMGTVNTGTSVIWRLWINADHTLTESSGKLCVDIREHGTDWTRGGTTNSTGFNDGNWHQIAFVHDCPNVVKIYVDGVSKAISYEYQAASGFINLDWSVTLGACNIRGTISDFALSILDEVRISDEERSVAWIKTSYESGRDDLVAYGSEETETAAAEYERSIEQGFVIAGSAPSGAEFGRVIEQGFSFGAVVAIVVEICKLLSQAFGFTASVGVTSAWGKSLAQDFSLDGSVEINREFDRGINQDFSFDGSVSVGAEYGREVSQDFSLTGAVSANMERWGAINQTFSVDGVVSRNLEAGRNIVQFFSLNAEVVGISEVAVALVQSFSLIGVAGANKEISRGISETFSVSATLGDAEEYDKGLSGDFSLGATVDIAVQKAEIEIGITQDFALADAVMAKEEYGKSLAQEFSFADSVAMNIECGRAVDQAFSFTAMVVATPELYEPQEYERQVSQNFSLSESVSMAKEVGQAISQEFSLTGEVATSSEYGRAIDHTFSFTATVVVANEVGKSVSQDFSFASEVTMNVERYPVEYDYILEEAFSFTGGILVNVEYNRAISQEFSFVGEVTIQVEEYVVEYVFAISGEFSFTDTVTVSIEYMAIAYTPTGPLKAVHQSVIVIRGQLKAFTPLENAVATLNIDNSFTFLQLYPENADMGNFGENEVKTAEWLVETPLIDKSQSYDFSVTWDYDYGGGSDSITSDNANTKVMPIPNPGGGGGTSPVVAAVIAIFVIIVIGLAIWSREG